MTPQVAFGHGIYDNNKSRLRHASTVTFSWKGKKKCLHLREVTNNCLKKSFLSHLMNQCISKGYIQGALVIGYL